jgi:tRNA(Ile)-lysidine synthase
MRNAPPDAQRDRFLNDCRAAGPVTRDQRIGVAVSGGADSLALLLLARAAFGAQVQAATVDHGLRPAAAHEAAFVSNVCADIGVAHMILRPPAPLPRGNISARARELRYALLQQWRASHRIDWLMTGHHADDQLETVIMRLNRGAGVGGLAGVRARNGNVLRPLLNWRRTELAALVSEAGYAPVDDPSNRDDRYDRARLRKMLAGADWLDPLAVSRAAAAFEDADRALAWSAQYWFEARVTGAGAALQFDAAGLPAELIRRILLACLHRLNPQARCDGPQLIRLLEILNKAGKATLAGVACDGRQSPWKLTIAPPRRRAGDIA